jgi:hypothetical protein
MKVIAEIPEPVEFECFWWQSIWWHIWFYTFVMWASEMMIPSLKKDKRLIRIQ